jgi:hypothetical protein
MHFSNRNKVLKQSRPIAKKLDMAQARVGNNIIVSGIIKRVAQISYRESVLVIKHGVAQKPDLQIYKRQIQQGYSSTGPEKAG